MLIDGALRFAHQALECWTEEMTEETIESLTRCRNIVFELLAGVNPQESELAGKVAGVYVFMVQSLTEAQLRRDRQRVEDAIKVLEVERETWRQVCEKMPLAPIPSNRAAEGVNEITAGQAQEKLDSAAPLPSTGTDGDAPQGGLVLDA
jgi:flagellar protein FliS